MPSKNASLTEQNIHVILRLPGDTVKFGLDEAVANALTTIMGSRGITEVKSHSVPIKRGSPFHDSCLVHGKYRGNRVVLHLRLAGSNYYTDKIEVDAKAPAEAVPMLQDISGVVHMLQIYRESDHRPTVREEEICFED